MISIIIPVYNAKKYLCKCLDSILSQSFKNWECILVDDGSIDDSGRICDDYAEKESRFHVIHKKNGGVSSARNIGLDNANGKWVTFIDADDYVLPSFLENLMVNTEHEDLICSGYKRFGDSNMNCQTPETKRYEISEYIHDIFEMSSNKKLRLGAISYPWGKLLKTDIIKNHKLRFNSKMKLSEDTCFMLQYLEFVYNVIVIKGGDYMYYTNNGPKAHLRMNFEEFKTHVDEMTIVVNHIGHKYAVDTAEYLTVMWSMYFEAFLNLIKSLDFKGVTQEYLKFEKEAIYKVDIYTKNMSSRKRLAVKLAFANRYMLFIMTKLFPSTF